MVEKNMEHTSQKRSITIKLPNIQEIRAKIKQWITFTKQYIRIHWFRFVLVGIAMYLMVEKDISIQVNMQDKIMVQSIGPMVEKPMMTSNQVAEKIPLKVKQQDQTMQFSVIDYLSKSFSPTKPAPTTPTKPVSSQILNPPVVPAAPLKPGPVVGNTYSNLAFAMDPTFAERKGVSPEVAKAKLDKCIAYVERFAPVAQSEMRKYGIPASIKLAQALLESNVGESRLSCQNHNHFGIKCFSKKCRRGHCSNFMDDTHKDFFRIFETDWESYRSHSLLLTGSRYRHLQKLGTKDYKGWANGLKAAGYATDPHYAQKLIKLIEGMKLYEYDG